MTTSVWDEIAGGFGEQLADELRGLVRRYAEQDDRSQQTDLGPSEIGDPCTRCLAEKILGQAESGGDPWCRTIGSAVHDWLEQAAAFDNHHPDHPGRWLHECRVHPSPDLLPRGGSCDLFDATRGIVIDHKVVGQEQQRKYRLNGPGLRYRRQSHLYGLGWAREGRDVRHVAVAFWLRGGRLQDLFVWSEPYSEQIAVEALERYRTLRDLVTAGGPAVIGSLPSDPACWVCSHRTT